MGYLMQTLSGSSGSFFILNKAIVLKYGVNVALMLTALAEGEELTSNGDEWFYQTRDTIAKFTGLKKTKQDNALKVLIDLGIVDKKVVGIPAKRYFRLNEKKLLEVLKEIESKKLLDSCLENDQQ